MNAEAEHHKRTILFTQWAQTLATLPTLWYTKTPEQTLKEIFMPETPRQYPRLGTTKKQPQPGSAENPLTVHHTFEDEVITKLDELIKLVNKLSQ